MRWKQKNGLLKETNSLCWKPWHGCSQATSWKFSSKYTGSGWYEAHPLRSMGWIHTSSRIWGIISPQMWHEAWVLPIWWTAELSGFWYQSYSVCVLKETNSLCWKPWHGCSQATSWKSTKHCLITKSRKTESIQCMLSWVYGLSSCCSFLLRNFMVVGMEASKSCAVWPETCKTACGDAVCTTAEFATGAACEKAPHKSDRDNRFCAILSVIVFKYSMQRNQHQFFCSCRRVDIGLVRNNSAFAPKHV